jgi:hypothetical protein
MHLFRFTRFFASIKSHRPETKNPVLETIPPVFIIV